MIVSHSLPAAASKNESSQMLGWGAGEQHLLCASGGHRRRIGGGGGSFSCYVLLFDFDSVMRFWCVCTQVFVSHCFLIDFVEQLFSFSCDFFILISGILFFMDYL